MKEETRIFMSTLAKVAKEHPLIGEIMNGFQGELKKNHGVDEAMFLVLLDQSSDSLREFFELISSGWDHLKRQEAFAKVEAQKKEIEASQSAEVLDSQATSESTVQIGGVKIGTETPPDSSPDEEPGADEGGDNDPN